MNYEKFTREQLLQLLKYKTKYGLVFEQPNDNPLFREEQVVIDCQNKIPILERVQSNDILNGFSNHLLIEGDNFHALLVLNTIYQNAIDFIYIDPPYNRGRNDFKYDDKFVEIENQYYHSKWLNFMKKRLMLAKNLLSDDGVIFISIDEHEHAQLKLLSDTVFGENNYLTTFIRKTKTMTGDDGNGLNIQHEYLHVYSRNKNLFTFVGEKKDLKGYSNPDNDPNGIWVSGDPSAKSGGETTYFPIENPITGQIDYPPNGRFWAFSKQTMDEYIQTGRISFKKKKYKNQRGFVFKRYASQLTSSTNPVGSLDFATNDYLNSVGTKELNFILGQTDFPYPKPSVFIRKLIEYSTKKDSIILDFFAGTGTTGQATLEMNELDDGNRRFILVTNDEDNIMKDVCYPRIKTVITGIRPDNTIYGPGIPDNIIYYKAEYVDRIKNDHETSKYNLLEKINDLLCMKENTFEQIGTGSNDHFIFINQTTKKMTVIYLDIFDEVKLGKLADDINDSDFNNYSKRLYVFSRDNNVDSDTEKYVSEAIKINKILPIPSNIYEIYRKSIEIIERKY